jgi:hypothetical protein
MGVTYMKINPIMAILSILSMLAISATLTEVTAARGAVVAYIQTADASQGPRYITFESLGDCHKYVKENSDFYDKSDCKRGSPPEEPPTEP